MRSCPKRTYILRINCWHDAATQRTGLGDGRILWESQSSACGCPDETRSSFKTQGPGVFSDKRGGRTVPPTLYGRKRPILRAPTTRILTIHQWRRSKVPMLRCPRVRGGSIGDMVRWSTIRVDFPTTWALHTPDAAPMWCSCHAMARPR